MPACIGNQFDLNTLAAALKVSPKQMIGRLTPAVNEGLIMPLGDGYKWIELDVSDMVPELKVEYRFCHDRIQQAAYSLVSDSHKSAIHSRIGHLLLEETSPTARQEKIFDIVDQLNRSTELITCDSERYTLAGLNLEAGRKAKLSAAFRPAYECLKTGMGLLDDKAWDQRHQLTLEVHVEAAECAYLDGDFHTMEDLVARVLLHSRTLLDRMKVYEIKMQARYAQSRLVDASGSGLGSIEAARGHIPCQTESNARSDRSDQDQDCLCRKAHRRSGLIAAND